MKETIDELLEQACPSIQYRLRLEVLNQPRSAQPMLDLQRQILNEKAVKEVIGRQGEDGWLAWNFHGYNSMEAGIRFLCEKGVDRDNPILSSALKALKEETDRLARGIGKPGWILDQSGLGGTRMIRAAVFAYAGIEDEPFIREQIAVALAGFRAVLAIDSIDDLVERYKGKLVYRQGIRWPSLYHLRLLALTHGWRTPQAQEEIARSVQRLVKLSPLPGLNARYRTQLIAPASFGMDDFNPDMAALDDAGWMMWFLRMELLARLGVIRCIPELEGQVSQLRALLEAGGGRFTKQLAHDYFRRWGAYTGLMLEADWRIPQRRINDLSFRSLLILNYCNR